MVKVRVQAVQALVLVMAATPAENITALMDSLMGMYLNLMT